MAFSASALAQEIARPSMSRRKDAPPSLARPYNLKLGPVALTANAGLGLEFVDNLNLSSTNLESDVIIRPAVSITGVWQVTKLNSLDLRTTFAYTKYLNHPELDSQAALVSPDSEIRLNIYVGDIKITIRDQFSIQEDPITDGSVSGVAKLGRFTNTIGIGMLWDLNDVIWSLGYDHLNLITTGDTSNTSGSKSNFSSLDRSTDQISSSIMFKLGPTTGLGLETTASYSRYPNNPLNDSANYTVGPFLDMQLTRYTQLTLGGGYSLFTSENEGQGGAAPEFISPSGVAGIGSVSVTPTQSGRGRSSGGDGSGYYINLTISHRLNRSYQDRLSIGREFQTGILSDRTESTFINYSSNWAVSRRFSVSTSLFFENVHQTSAQTSLADFRRYGVSVSTSYLLTKKMNVGISYQFTQKTAEVAGQDYAQNRISVQFGYQF